MMGIKLVNRRIELDNLLPHPLSYLYFDIVQTQLGVHYGITWWCARAIHY